MPPKRKTLLWFLCTVLLIPSQIVLAVSGQQGTGGYYTYLPTIMNRYAPPYSVRVNVPYFSGNAADHFSEAAIFWFGKVSPSENYADVRFAYDQTKLWVYVAVFDRNLWYNPSQSNPSTLTDWDAITLLISLNGNTGSLPDANSYRFIGAMSWTGDYSESRYQAAYRGNGSGWALASVNFKTRPGYRSPFNDNSTNGRGWAMTFEIPFSSLGLSGRPSDGTLWGVGVQMHDRDSQAGPPQPVKNWPDFMQRDNPSTWAQLRFGLPAYGAQPGNPAGTTLIREDPAKGIAVPDAGVGGTIDNLCPGDENFIWNQWGNLNFGSGTGVNLQNQSDVADWPCFSKYYITFPLTPIPSGKTILSAKLILHQWGGSNGTPPPVASLIQVFTVKEDWAEGSITWNNAPPPLENVSQAWVDVYFMPTNGWPGAARSWDVTYAAIRAYESGQPLRLALYEADSNYHSGKHFTTSETESWNLEGRPTLEIKWSN